MIAMQRKLLRKSETIFIIHFMVCFWMIFESLWIYYYKTNFSCDSTITMAGNCDLYFDFSAFLPFLVFHSCVHQTSIIHFQLNELKIYSDDNHHRFLHFLILVFHLLLLFLFLLLRFLLFPSFYLLFLFSFFFWSPTVTSISYCHWIFYIIRLIIIFFFMRIVWNYFFACLSLIFFHFFPVLVLQRLFFHLKSFSW